MIATIRVVGQFSSDIILSEMILRVGILRKCFVFVREKGINLRLHRVLFRTHRHTKTPLVISSGQEKAAWVPVGRQCECTKYQYDVRYSTSAYGDGRSQNSSTAWWEKKGSKTLVDIYDTQDHYLGWKSITYHIARVWETHIYPCLQLRGLQNSQSNFEESCVGAICIFHYNWSEERGTDTAKLAQNIVHTKVGQVHCI